VPPTGSHGGDGARVATALGLDPATMIDLSASMNPFAPDVAVVLGGLLGHSGAAVHRYPDPTRATSLLADTIGVDPDQLVLTNGGAEAIALTATHLQVGNVVEPEFSLYRRHLAAVDPAAGRWRSNPSNPLGQLAEPDEAAGVWDEAFYPIAAGRWTRGDVGVWRLGSLTKLWNCPGLRLGYVIAPTAAEAHAIRHLQPRWSVNGLALTALPELLAATDLVRWAADIARLRDRFATELGALGFRVTVTDSNWVLVEQADLRASLARLGVLVRDCASFGLTDVHRVALPPPHEFDSVLGAFAAVADQ
jgi:threonine-phosphate decarboxylase